MSGDLGSNGSLPTLDLVARVQTRLWRQETLGRLRRGFYGATGVATLVTGLVLWFGNPFAGGAGPDPAAQGLGSLAPWALFLLGAAPPVAALVYALRRRPSAAAAALEADRRAGAGQLLLTAWELAQGRPASGAGPLLLRQAEREAPRWEALILAHPAGPGPRSLLPPLLLWAATIPWLLVSPPQVLNGSVALDGRPPPSMPSRGPGSARNLAAAIADLSRATAANSKSADPALRPPGAPAASADGTQRSLDSSNQGPESTILPGRPPVGSSALAGDPGSPAAADPAQDATPAAQSSGAAGTQGAGTQVPAAGLDPGPAPRAPPPGAFAVQPLARTGTPSVASDQRGEPLETTNRGPRRLPPAAGHPVLGPAAAIPPPHFTSGLGAAERALLARYWTQLKLRSEE